jgi:S-(hydroxymethyl)glutathione dehydrogenase/alcohol dehydrogenase
MGTSTFSQYTVVADVSIVAVDKKAPLEKVCLLGCGITTAWGAVAKQAGISTACPPRYRKHGLNQMLLEGSTVAVFGVGAIGLGVISTSQKVGASRIIAIDVNPAKESWATKFGATDFVNPGHLKVGQKIQDVLIEMTDGGCDFTFDCTGNVSREALLLVCQKGNPPISTG